MSKYISIPRIVEDYLEKTCLKNEEGNREESEGTQLIRMFNLDRKERSEAKQ